MSDKNDSGQQADSIEDRDSFPLQRWVIYLCCFMALAMVIMGRIETFHDTEMEALVNGYGYWLGALLFGGIALGLTGR